LSASGAASPADIKGGTTVNLGSRPITLLHDGTNPALTVSQGALTLNGNAFTVHSTNPLPAGSYTLIQQGSGTITNSGSFTVAGTAISGSTASLDFGTAGAVKLNLVAASVSDTNSTLAASTATLAADNVATSTLTITLRDAANAPLAGVGVKWAVSGSSNTVAPSDYGTTDGSGVATFTVKSRKAETKTVTVTVGAFTFTTDLVFTAPATGFTFTWDPLLTKTASDGAGTWNLTTANWAEGGANSIWLNNGNDAAIFGTGGALAAITTVTIGAPITVGNLTFNNTSANTNQYIITGAGSNILTLAGTPTINVAANAMITSPLAGVGFIKEGGGTLRIDGNSPSYSGAVTVNAGLLQVGNNGAGGNLGNNTITLAGSATFVIRKGSGGNMTLNNTLTGATSANVGFQLNNNATITVAKANTYTAGTGTYLQPTGANTVGTLALGIADGLPTTTAFSINANGTTSLQTFDLAGFNQTVASLGGTGTATTAVITSSSGTPVLTVSGNATTTFAGLVSGSLSLTKAGSGSQTFSGNATYSGNTTVTEGTLSLPNDNASNDTSTVTIASTGATLDLNFVGSDTVGTLFIGGVQQAAGVYEAIGNAGSGIEIAQITGAGTLTVLSGVVADTTPPAAPTIGLLAASDTGSSSSDLITNLTTPTLRVTLNGTGPTAPLAGDVVKLFNGATQVASATLSAGDITATFVDLTTSVLAPGSLSFTATVTDAASNVSSPSTALLVTLDTTAPVITVTSPSSNSAAWGATYTDAGATASDDLAPFTATVNTTNPVSTAAPGLYTVTYNATDVAGNNATPATRAVTVAIANATTVGADGFSPLMKYAFGATSPIDTVQAPALSSTASTLALTAVVRTNDANVVVSGEAVDSLTGTWGTGGTVTMTVAGDQTNLPANCQRRVFTVDTTAATRKFLRLKVVSTP
jgi:autotransporter-associated beta strand protein